MEAGEEWGSNSRATTVEVTTTATTMAHMVSSNGRVVADVAIRGVRDASRTDFETANWFGHGTTEIPQRKHIFNSINDILEP